MLADSMHGPNSANQEAISQTGIFDLGDRIFGKIRFEEPKDDLEVEREKNIVRSRLKSAVTACLLAFLEGVTGDAIPQQMLQTVQWSSITCQMDHCFRIRENNAVMDSNMATKEGLNYYFLMKHVEHYDHNHSIIAPCLREYPEAIRFFAKQTGYVEIFRHQRLERVYFQLPANCIQGGPLDKNFEELFDTEREDPDKKNKEFLENMLRLVAKEELHSRIRSSMFAFTVNKWEAIRGASFMWALLIHFLLILGSYAPRGRYDEDYKKIIDNAGEDSGYEKQFYDKVYPTTTVAAQMLDWIQLAIALVRFFSFAWAELPSMIIQGLEVDDQSTEKTQVQADSQVDKEDDAMGDGVFDFVEDQQEVSHGQIDSTAAEEADDPQRSGGPTMSYASQIVVVTSVILSSFKAIYEICFLAFMTLAVVMDEPLLTCYALLEICFWKGSRTVIDAIYFNLSKMIQTVVLGFLVLYIWMIIGMFTLPSLHDEGYCTNLFQCFISYILKGMRDNGVTEVI